MAHMKILIAGMPRSGSTFTFNVVRELLSATGSVAQEATGSFSPALLRSRSHYIAKAHQLTPESLARLKAGDFHSILSYRNPADAVASLMHTFGFSLLHAIDACRNWYVLYQELKDTSLCLPYECIDTRSTEAIRMIVRHLDLAVGQQEICRIASLLDKNRIRERFANLGEDADGVEAIGFSHFDKTTFFHRRHVNTWHGTAAEEVLTPAQRIIVGNELGEIARHLQAGSGFATDDVMQPAPELSALDS